MNTATTSKVMMIRPVQFRFNEQTAGNNSFQVKPTSQQLLSQKQAAVEFDTLVNTLKEKGVDVLVVSDDEHSDTPDSIFPNNWISLHETGEIVLYPMFAENRRKEVRQDIIDQLMNDYGFEEVNDWTAFAQTNKFLEGTGSFVLDRKNKIAYACVSVRTDKELAEKWGEQMNYKVVTFDAVDTKGFPIYHTNVMMNVGEHYAIVCFECMPYAEEQNLLRASLEHSGKEVIEISYKQVENFAGNMLELSNQEGKSLLVMSQAAHDSLSDEQIEVINKYSEIVSSPISTIEVNGGGSVRCMIAEIFAPKK